MRIGATALIVWGLTIAAAALAGNCRSGIDCRYGGTVMRMPAGRARIRTRSEASTSGDRPSSRWMSLHQSGACFYINFSYDIFI